jgi:hypothetical protein
VVVVEAHAPGGRARTDERSGYRFNQGLHAVARGGEAWRILRHLGVPHRGHRPPQRGARVVRDGKLAGVPVGQLGLLIPRLLTVSAASWAGRSAEEWVESLEGSRDLSGLARMLIRVTTYVTDLRGMPWEVALASGEVLPAAAVVVAAGSPAVARKLLPVDPGWPELGPRSPPPAWTSGCAGLTLRW